MDETKGISRMTDTERIIDGLRGIGRGIIDYVGIEDAKACMKVLDETVELLKEQKNDLRIMFNRCKATAKLLTSGGACKHCGMREKCGAGD